ncbi:MAG: thiamine-phosphate kinase, partial [Acidobacteriota bacterium]
MSDSKRLGEFDLIAHCFAPLVKDTPGALGLLDDAALLSPTPGCELVLTADAMIAGRHFFDDDPPDLVARKLLRVNLSDLAGMGARPRGFLVTAAWNAETGDAWVEAFARGLGEDARDFACPLLGGDTTATEGPLALSLTALGEVSRGKALRRAGARPGELLAVTGTIGDGALGLLVQ